jgi:peptidyl-tRNA hydrolase
MSEKEWLEKVEVKDDRPCEEKLQNLLDVVHDCMATMKTMIKMEEELKQVKELMTAYKLESRGYKVIIDKLDESIGNVEQLAGKTGLTPTWQTLLNELKVIRSAK